MRAAHLARMRAACPSTVKFMRHAVEPILLAHCARGARLAHSAPDAGKEKTGISVALPLALAAYAQFSPASPTEK